MWLRRTNPISEKRDALCCALTQAYVADSLIFIGQTQARSMFFFYQCVSLEVEIILFLSDLRIFYFLFSCYLSFALKKIIQAAGPLEPSNVLGVGK